MERGGPFSRLIRLLFGCRPSGQSRASSGGKAGSFIYRPVPVCSPVRAGAFPGGPVRVRYGGIGREPGVFVNPINLAWNCLLAHVRYGSRSGPVRARCRWEESSRTRTGRFIVSIGLLFRREALGAVFGFRLRNARYPVMIAVASRFGTVALTTVL